MSDSMDLDSTSVNNRSQVESEEDDVYLSLFHGAGKLGGAFYNVTDGVLHLMNDLVDPPPLHKIAITVLSQLNPKHVLLCSRHKESFSKAMNRFSNKIDTIITEDLSATDTTTDEGSTVTAGAEMTANTTTGLNDSLAGIEDVKVLPGVDFALGSSRRRLMSLRLPGESDASLEDHHLMIHSLIDPLSEDMIRAAGALLKFLDKSQIGGLNLDGSGGVPILAIKHFTPKDIVRIDETTLSALHIFNSRWQNSGTRSGSFNQRREGLSIYSLLNNCKSIMGSRHLKFLLRCLPRDLGEIQARHDAIAFLSHPSNADVMKMLRETIKKIKTIGRYLKKLSLNQASVQDWKTLKATLANMLALGQICMNCTEIPSSSSKRHGNSPEILRKIAQLSLGNNSLVTIVKTLEKVFDVEESENQGRFVVKHGIDPDLDEKKRMHDGLPEMMMEIAQTEIHQLPDCIRTCSMVYMPQVGYLLAVDPWSTFDEEDKASMELPDLKFMFVSNGQVHYKSAKCYEIDQTIGDTATHICDHETSIMLAMATHVLEQSGLILDIAHAISQLDCLLALSMVAKENNWCKPNIVEAGQSLEIKDGRHPLQEQCVQTFVSNDTEMSQDESKMIVMTGPNACGKSVYLKQIGVIAFLAHLGSWVPAAQATIPLLDAIYSRIQTTDSIALGLSAFAVDLNQVSMALNNAKGNSLVLIDEFGKGTSDVDGQALLAGTLEFWLSQENESPFVVVSTHFHSLPQLLSRWLDRVKFLTLMFDKQEDGEINYLYKVIGGTLNHSEAGFVAKKAGIEDKILLRSQEILSCIATGGNLSLESKHPALEGKNFETLTQVLDDFQRLQLDEENLSQIFETLENLLQNTS